MNLFRSEEHARRWTGFEAPAAAGPLSFADMMRIMSTPRHRERRSGHYVSAAPGHLAAFVERLREVTGGSAFWDPAL
jgi:hypothetical protein